MYCKLYWYAPFNSNIIVLIVAKCIVNSAFISSYLLKASVLIVAKCIVNTGQKILFRGLDDVLIVAKCIVNIDNNPSEDDI